MSYLQAADQSTFSSSSAGAIISADVSEPNVLDATTTALLRALLDEVCQGLPGSEIGLRAHVASKMLAAASMGEKRADQLRQVAREALRSAPTMWRQA